MMQSGGGAGFAQRALEHNGPFVGIGDLREDDFLDGHLPAEQFIGRRPDDTDATAPERRVQVVATGHHPRAGVLGGDRHRSDSNGETRRTSPVP